jgi:hypothetical protein
MRCLQSLREYLSSKDPEEGGGGLRFRLWEVHPLLCLPGDLSERSHHDSTRMGFEILQSRMTNIQYSITNGR